MYVLQSNSGRARCENTRANADSASANNGDFTLARFGVEGD